MPKFEKLKNGDVLYQRCRDRYRGWEYWQVKIIELHQETRTASVSWNNNLPTTFSEMKLEKLFRTPYSKQEEKRREAKGER